MVVKPDFEEFARRFERLLQQQVQRCEEEAAHARATARRIAAAQSQRRASEQPRQEQYREIITARSHAKQGSVGDARRIPTAMRGTSHRLSRFGPSSRGTAAAAAGHYGLTEGMPQTRRGPISGVLREQPPPGAPQT